MSVQKIGYARVSTEDQSLALQWDALTAAGCVRIFEDRASGARANRQGLAGAVAACGVGDTLVIWKLDRVGRSLSDLVSLVSVLRKGEVGLKVLTGAGVAIDTTTAEGRLVYNLIASVAEFEHEMIRERTVAGMAAARRSGKRLGRPAKLSPDRLNVAAQLLADGEPWRKVARIFGVSTSTLRASLERQAAVLRRRRALVLSGEGPQIDLEGYLHEKAS